MPFTIQISTDNFATFKNVFYALDEQFTLSSEQSTKYASQHAAMHHYAGVKHKLHAELETDARCSIIIPAYSARIVEA